MNPELVHQAVVKITDWGEVERWCDENVGKWNQDWYKLGIDVARLVIAIESKDYYVETTWFFREERDKTMFLLRWL